MPTLRLRNIARLHVSETQELLLNQASGRITDSIPGDEHVIEEDGHGVLVCPGFVDLQFNGAFGIDFSRPTLRAEDAARVLSGLLQFGVTSVAPTLISSSRETYEHSLGVFAALWRSSGLREPFAASETLASSAVSPRILGMHLEGPFLNVGRKGAHKPEHLHAPASAAAAATAGADALSCDCTIRSAAGHGREPRTDLQATYGPAVAYLQRPRSGDGASGAAASASDGSSATGASSAVSAAEDDADDRGFVRIITLAPELDGALPLIKHLSSCHGTTAAPSVTPPVAAKVVSFATLEQPAVDDDDDDGHFRGVVCSIGHTAATYDTADAAVAAGARLVTHLYNAMPQLSHRGDPGPIALLGRAAKAPAPSAAAGPSHAAGGAGAAEASSGASSSVSSSKPLVGPPYFSLIADGAHCHPAAAALAFRTAPHRCVLVTDAMPALGCPPGRLTYGDLAVTVHAGAEAGRVPWPACGAGGNHHAGWGRGPAGPLCPQPSRSGGRAPSLPADADVPTLTSSRCCSRYGDHRRLAWPGRRHRLRHVQPGQAAGPGRRHRLAAAGRCG